MKLSQDARAILDLAHEDYYALFEVRQNREKAEAGIKELLANGLIELFRKTGEQGYQLIPQNEHMAALDDVNWDPEIKGNDFILFTTTAEGDRVYFSENSI